MGCEVKISNSGILALCSVLLTPILCCLCLSVELIGPKKHWHMAWETSNTVFGHQEQILVSYLLLENCKVYCSFAWIILIIIMAGLKIHQL